MRIPTTTAQVSTSSAFFTSGGHVASSTLKRSHPPPQQLQHATKVSCAFSPSGAHHSRRVVSVTLVFLHSLCIIPKEAIGGSVFDKYLKKKRLDPLEAYIPAVILAQLQIEELGKSLDADQPKYAECRNLLRSGPASSLRINIRAVAQYASDDGNGKSADISVDQCLRALEELDSLLLRASRKDADASIESMKVKVSTALLALDGLLKTVPSDVLDKGKAIANAYQPQEDIAPDSEDPELKQLESLL